MTTNLRVKVATADLISRIEEVTKADEAEIAKIEAELEGWESRADASLKALKEARAEDGADASSFQAELKNQYEQFRKPVYSSDLHNLKRKVDGAKRALALLKTSKQDTITLADDSYYTTFLVGGE